MPRKSLPLPPIELLLSLFVVEDGVLLNKIDRKMVKAGQRSGCEKDGYIWVKVNGQRYSAHRLIFFMQHGYCPEYIDHIDGNGLNNRIENLRPATLSQNKANQRVYGNNVSGVKGVYWCHPKKAWVAQIAFNKRRRTLGTFSTKELAAEFVALVRDELHGQFANHGTHQGA
jgi:hypothetical protein